MPPTSTRYPDALNPEKVGTYPASVFAGGGYVWDAVLEYRVWCHSVREGDYFYAFANYYVALKFSKKTRNAQEPLALILQEEYLDEPEDGVYIHVRKQRMTEWPVMFLSRPKRTPQTIPDFLAPDAPPNRLAILRGLA